MRNTWAFSFFVGTLLVPFALAGQQQDHNDAFVRGSESESKLAHRVRHELVMLPYYTIFDDLAFRVNDSTVTLFGDVTNPVLKSDAENVVKRLEGVTQVINKINVLPLSSMDDQIRRAEFRAIYGDPQIGDRYGRTPGEVAIAWTLHNFAVTAAIVGVRTPEQVHGIIGAGEFRLDIFEAGQIDLALRHEALVA